MEPWAPRLKGACQCCPGDGRIKRTWGGWRKHLAQVPPTESQCADALKGCKLQGGPGASYKGSLCSMNPGQIREFIYEKDNSSFLPYKGASQQPEKHPKILGDTCNCEVLFLLTSLGTVISCLLVSFHQTNTPHLYPRTGVPLSDSCLKSLTWSEQPLLTLVTRVRARPKGLQRAVSWNNRSLQRSRYTMYFKPLHVQGYLSWSLAKQAV